MLFILQLLVSTLAVLVTTYLLPGIAVSSFWTALVVSIVLGIFNAFLWPILLIITLPINILTLGLFTFVIMGFLVLLASYIIPGFTVRNFWWALAFSIVLSIVNAFFASLRIHH